MTDKKFIYLSIIPLILMVVLIGIVPLIYSFNLSLRDFSLLQKTHEFIGLTNYINLFSNERFIHAAVFTIIFALVATGIELVIGFILAYVLADKSVSKKYSSIMRTLMMIPYIVAPVAISYVFKSLIYDPSSGYLNYFLRLLNLPQFIIFQGMYNGIIAILVLEIILRTPFITLILYAGISAIPDSVIEAAEIDGANFMQRIFRIIIPHTSSVIAVAFIFRFMSAVKMFDEVYVVTGGGPGFLTENLSLYASAQAFEFFHNGYAAAATIVFFIAIVIIINIFLKASKFGVD